MSDSTFFSGLSKYSGTSEIQSPDGSDRSSRVLDQKKLALCSTTEARALIPYDIAVKMEVLPLGCNDNNYTATVSFAVREDYSRDLKSALAFVVGRPVSLIPVERGLIRPALFLAYNRDGVGLDRKLALLNSKERQGMSRDVLLDFHPPSGEAAQFLSALIEHVLALGASDLHILPRGSGSYVEIRVQGELMKREAPLCGLAVHEQLVGRIKVLSGLDITQKSLPQDGSFSIPLASGIARARTSIMPTLYGEKAVIRFHGSEEILTLKELCLPPILNEWIEELCKTREGIVLCSGATGSGKTTTMYGILSELRKQNISIVSVEDPIERIVEGVSQTALNDKQGLTYPRALKALVRQDPDVLLIGEIRDEESARISFEAGLTGHLILSTVHGRGVTDVLLRLKDLSVDPLTVAQGLELIMSQKLLGKLCPHCKVRDHEATSRLGGSVFKKHGCKECEYSGYSGMIMIAEALRIRTAIRELLKSGIYGAGVIEAARSSGDYLDPSVCLLMGIREGYIEEREV